MIRTVFSTSLPMGETMVVRKNHIEGPYRRGPRVVVATGIHGDELEGQFVAFELARTLLERISDVHGTVDIYPALNPLGLSANTHGVPNLDIGLDHSFPGDADGSPTEALAAALLADMRGAAACVIVHSSASVMQELPQVRIVEGGPRQLMRLATLLNMQLVWRRPAAPGAHATLPHALTEAGVPTLVVEMGSGMRISREHGTWMVDGICRLLEHLGIWTGPIIMSPPPIVTTGDDVADLVSETPGLFTPLSAHGTYVRHGEVIGRICDPMAGTVAQDVTSPISGLLFSLRVYPMVHPGSLLARVVEARR